MRNKDEIDSLLNSYRMFLVAVEKESDPKNIFTTITTGMLKTNIEILEWVMGKEMQIEPEKNYDKMSYH